jgi:cytochrome c peroxidase
VTIHWPHKYPQQGQDKRRGSVGSGAILTGVALAWIAVAGIRGGAAADEGPFYANAFQKAPSVAAVTAIGRAVFYDASLSVSGKMACASCHDPARAFGPPDDAPVQRGGADGRQYGVRAVPSLMYAQNIPQFTEHLFDDEGDDSIDQGPAGGRMWDGRASSAHDQARLPLFSVYEMANANAHAVVAKVARATYATQFRETFGDKVFGDQALVLKGALLALETFQQTPAEFYPYSSKYDAFLRGEASLGADELRGLATFNDPAKGNCARCHPSTVRAGAFPQFTDYGYAALGAPRNMAIPANANPRYYDLGLCGPLRTDLADAKGYCGLFRTPTLRNVATRRVFMHNGVFHRLEDVLRFYAQRDTQPQRWYSRAPDGSVRKFDDLPLQYRRNVDTVGPFGRHPGDRPAFGEGDIRDMIAFLNTLTDGYVRGR